MQFEETAIEGDARNQLADIARVCGRSPVQAIRELPNWEETASIVKQGDHLVGAYNGIWTLLWGWDYTDLDLYFYPERAAAVSRALGTRVVSGYGYTVIDSWGIRIHTPEGSRSFVVDQNTVVEHADGPPFRIAPDDESSFDLFRARDILWELGIYTPPEIGHQFAAVQLVPARLDEPLTQ